MVNGNALIGQSGGPTSVINSSLAGILDPDMQKVNRFVIYQIIGRDAGWLAAERALASKDKDNAPHLNYAPEYIKAEKDFT